MLVDAIAAGRPVVATAFPHAVELLSSGAGIVVDHDDPEALAARPAPGPHRARPGRVHGRGGGAPGPRPGLAGRGPRLSRAGRPTSWPIGRRWYDRDTGTPLRPPRPHDRRPGHRSSTRGSTSPAGSTATAPTTWPGSSSSPRGNPTHGRDVRRPGRHRACGSWATPRASTATYRNRMNRRAVGTTGPRVGGLLGAEPLGSRHGGGAQPTPTGYARSATAQFERAARQRSPWPRAMAFAALGAAEVLAARPWAPRRLGRCSTDAADGMAPAR